MGLSCLIDDTRAAAAGLVLSCALAAGAVQAQDVADPDRLYRVVDLPRGEGLPLRRQPGTEGEAIGLLPPQARDVVLSGAVVEAAGERWYEVVDERGSAWARAAHLRAQPGRVEANYPLLCTGTEPFWSLSTEAGRARFSTPEIEDVEWDAGDWLPARGLTGRFMVRMESAYGTGYLAVIRARQFCSDGMSEMNYPFEALLITPAQAVRGGCCRRGG